MNKRCFFITGATGLLGGYLLDRLINHQHHELHLLVRGTDHEKAIQRIRQLGRYFGHDQWPDHVFIHRGTISHPTLGLSPAAQSILQNRITDIVHAAASISFTDESTNQIVNTAGTQHLLNLTSPAARLYYVSTAYVAGMVPHFREDQLDVNQSFRNNYEQSKREAEHIVRQHYHDRPDLLTVLRPSIITGESKTGRTFQFMTLYRVLRSLVAFARRYPNETFSLPYNPNSTQNYIPIDHLTDMIEEVIIHPQCWSKTYHLVNDSPILNEDFRVLLERQLKLRIQNKAPDHDSTNMNRSAVAGNAAYLDYLQGEPTFDCTNRNQLTSAHQILTFNADYLNRLIDFCQRTDWGKKRVICR